MNLLKKISPGSLDRAQSYIKSFRPSPHVWTQFGFGIIETLVCLGIMGVVAAGMASLFLAQQKQIRALLQKQEIVDLRTVVVRQLGITNNCTWQLKDKLISIAPPPTMTNPSSSVIRFSGNTLYWGTSIASVPIAVEGQFIPNSNNRVRIQEISYKNIYPTAPGSSEYNGTIEINFDPQSTALNMKPLQIPLTVVTIPVNPSTVKIASCGISGPAATGITAQVFNFPGGTFRASVSGIHKVTIVGGGGGGGGGLNQPTACFGAGGGGAGGTVLYYANLTANTDYPVVVGSGGLGAIAGTSANGGLGGNSSMNGVVANGGGAGLGSWWAGGGAGGSGSGSGTVMVIPGGPGGIGGSADFAANTVTSGAGGNGGNSYFGGGGMGGLAGGSGTTSGVYGAGGGGASGQNGAGGSGSSGVVLIEWNQ